MKNALLGIVMLLHFLPTCHAQDQTGVEQGQPGIGQNLSSTTEKVINFPSTFFSRVDRQTSRLNAALARQTQQYLNKLAKQEDKIRKKLYQQDSVQAKKLFGGPGLDYNALSQRLQNQSTPLTGAAGRRISGAYLPYLDSLKTSLKFLQQNPSLLSGGASQLVEVNSSLAQVNELQGKMQMATQTQQLITQRKQQIMQALSQNARLPAGLQNAYQGYSRQAYYYGAQIKTYKDELSDPDKLTQKALGMLGQLGSFQQFMKTHSEIAGIFSLPGGVGSGGARALSGLQTRSGVQQMLGAQVAAGGPDAAAAVSQKIQSAQAALKSLKDRVTQAGGGSSSMDIPDFRPNPEHTKTFLKRLIYGFDIQSVRSSYEFPTTTDLGVSLGYMLNGRSTIGIGASYKMGWGQDISHISVSSQGMSLRSFLQTKIKGSFFFTAGYEYNYQQPIYSLSQIQELSRWTPSGLIGVTKQYKIGSKMKGNVQLLWDFLSYQQVPKTQPVLFRVGYTF